MGEHEKEKEHVITIIYLSKWVQGFIWAIAIVYMNNCNYIDESSQLLMIK